MRVADLGQVRIVDFICVEDDGITLIEQLPIIG